MAKFKIELEIKKGQTMLLSDFDSSDEYDNSITFDENLEEMENDAYELSFSVPQYIGDNNEINIGKLMSIGRVLKLTFSNPERRVDFVISGFSIDEGTENTIFNVEAKDYASYVFTRNNVGLNLDTIDDEDFWEYMGESEDTIISKIGNYILERGHLRKRLKIPKNGSYYTGWKVQCDDKTYRKYSEDGDHIDTDLGEYYDLLYFKYNISVSNSNTYNALIELANNSDSMLRIDYGNKKIEFIYRDNVDNLEKNYTLKDSFNIQDSSLSYDGENLYSLFYIQGGTNIDDEYVILSDKTEYKDNFLYDFSYFKEKGFLTDQQISDIQDLIEGDSVPSEYAFTTRTLKQINIEFQNIIRRKYEIQEEIRLLKNKIRISAEAALAGGDSESFDIDNYKNKIDDLKNCFMQRDEKITTETGGPRIISYESFDWSGNSLFPIFNEEIDLENKELPYYRASLPIKFRITTKSRIITTEEDNNGVSEILKIPHLGSGISNPPWYYKFKISLRKQTTGTGAYTWKEYEQDGFKFWICMIAKNSGDPGGDSDYKTEISPFIISSFMEYKYIKEDTFKFTYLFPYFDALWSYDGTKSINKEKIELNDRIDQIRNDWLKDEQELLLLINPSTETEEARKSLLEKNIETYRIGIGEYEFESGIINEPDKLKEDETKPGFYQTILNYFEEYENLYYAQVPERPIPLMPRYREVLKEKNDFWYGMKEYFGRNIFSEGYYENEIETDTLNLKNQAELIYKQHQKPNQDFSVSYINLSDIIGIDLQEIRVGDYVRVEKEKFKVEQSEDSKIQVSAISRQLRSDADIQLTITKYNMINKLIEQIVANSQASSNK